MWLDNKFQSVENQKITWLPYNDKTKTIFYDQRVAITQEREIPICWSCTKVEDMNVKGIIRVTWKQGKYDEHLDYIERDENGKIIGTWCDYYKNGIEPKEPEPTPENIYSKVTCNGNSSLMVINGSPKRFTVKFYDGNDEIEVQSGEWKFEIESVDVSDEIEVVELQDNSIKVKFIGDSFYIGKNLAVKYVSDSGIESELVLELSGL